MRLTPLVLLSAMTLLAAVPAAAYPMRIAGGDALFLDPAFDVRSVPQSDQLVGTWAEAEPVPLEGRLGWSIQSARLAELRDSGAAADPRLWQDDEAIPGLIEEEAAGDFVWLWFTPQAPLLPFTPYVFAFGDEGDMRSEFQTHDGELGNLEASDPEVSLSVTWSGQRPNSDPSLTFNLTMGVDRSPIGSSRLSVMRVFLEDDEGFLVLDRVAAAGNERAAFAWWQEFPGRGTARPDEVCVTVVHENGEGQLSDPVEVCSEPEVSWGCSVGAGTPGATGLLVGLGLVPLLGCRRRRL